MVGAAPKSREVADPSPCLGSIPQILASPQMQAKLYSHISTIHMVCKQMGAAGSCFTPLHRSDSSLPSRLPCSPGGGVPY